ncbi:MAG: hypothetical protein ACRENB_01325 [Gemmatimonadales bacterium]
MGTSRSISRALVGAVAVITLAGCAGDSPVATQGPEPSHSLLGAVLDATLLRCSALPASSVTAVIGSSGGTITAGPHRLVVPPGALAGPVAITAEVVSGTVNSMRFSPEGLRFAVPASLTMSYRNCPLARLLPLKKIAYTSELLSILELLRSVDHLGSSEVTGQLEHFSRYAIAY